MKEWEKEPAEEIVKRFINYIWRKNKKWLFESYNFYAEYNNKPTSNKKSHIIKDSYYLMHLITEIGVADMWAVYQYRKEV